ncbi:MAG: DNA-3-methyladenine glycosylase family protein [Candidatus Dormibacterales bacterium]
MPPDSRASFLLSKPLDLTATLAHTAAGSAMRMAGDEVWRATRTPAGTATVHIRHERGAVEVEGWGAGAEWVVAQAPLLVGEADDSEGFVPVHPLIARLHRSHPGLRMPRTHAVFEALVPTVIGQLVAGAEAHASYRALVRELGEAAPGPIHMTIAPSAKVLAHTPYWTFHGFGIERKRAETIIRAARSAGRLEEIVGMTREDAYRRLLAFPGVGPWTAAHVAAVAVGDADAVPLGDYHLPHTIGYALEGTARSTDERMLELLEPYLGHRGRVIRLIAIAGITAPRFGPRQPLRDIIRG